MLTPLLTSFVYRRVNQRRALRGERLAGNAVTGMEPGALDIATTQPLGQV